MIDWNQIGGAATAGSVIIGALYACTMGLWKAIRNKFDAQDEARTTQLGEMEKRVVDAFQAHEELDKERHSDNLKKFEKQDDLLTDIRLSLASAGLNGRKKQEAQDGGGR